MCILSCAKPICPEPQTTSNTTAIIAPITIIDTTAVQAVKQKYVIVLQPGSEGKDAIINTIGSSVGHASQTYLPTRAWTVSGTYLLENSIIQFDYSSIPEGAVINKATLTLFADTTLDIGSLGHSQLSGSNAWSLKRVTQAWEESTVTWNTQPTTDLNNIIQCAASTSASQEYSIQLTSWVADEIAHPTSYYGFLMEINNDTPYRSIVFCSSDNPYPQLRPKMAIEYTK